ncbi:MAG: YSC84-related protein [Pseudomonadota bacterium]
MKASLISLVALVVITSGCVTGATPADQRSAIQDMRTETLTRLYAEKPSARAELAAAPGYGVFSSANVNVILASFAGGYGLIRDNATGSDTYMKMGEVGVGLGAGVKDYRLVFVFHDATTMSDFINKGWSFGGQADAAAKAGDQGGAVGGEAIADGVSVYQLTESGLALQATVKGTRYWKDKALN